MVHNLTTTVMAAIAAGAYRGNVYLLQPVGTNQGNIVSLLPQEDAMAAIPTKGSREVHGPA